MGVGVGTVVGCSVGSVTGTVGDGLAVGRETAVSGGVNVIVAAGGLSVVVTDVGASCPLDWVQAANAIRRTAEKENAAVSLTPWHPFSRRYESRAVWSIGQP